MAEPSVEYASRQLSGSSLSASCRTPAAPRVVELARAGPYAGHRTLIRTLVELPGGVLRRALLLHWRPHQNVGRIVGWLSAEPERDPEGVLSRPEVIRRTGFASAQEQRDTPDRGAPLAIIEGFTGCVGYIFRR